MREKRRFIIIVLIIGGMAYVQVIDWNLSYHGKTEDKIELLKAVIEDVNGEYPCVVAVQGVTERIKSLTIISI